MTDKPQQQKRQPPVNVRSCIEISLLVAVVSLFLWTIYSQITIMMIRNRLDYHRYIVDINEYRVLPLRAPLTLQSPAPFAHGHFAIDFGQLEVRWKISAVTYNETVGSLDLRGPLTSATPFVAEVALAMGLQKHKYKPRYEGLVDINGKLAADIIERPDAYYISFANSAGNEMMRDSLGKTAYSNL